MISYSVIIPVYNRGNSIINCLNSVLIQRVKPVEVIIVDDNSTDNTKDIIKSLKNPLIKLVELKENKGAQHARNIGVKETKTDWIAFIDSDDVWENNKIDIQLDELKKYNFSDEYFTNGICYRVFQEDDRQEVWNLSFNGNSHNKIYQNLLIEPGPMFQGLLVSKQKLKEISYLDEEIISYQEWDTHLRLMKVAKPLWIKTPLFTYYINKSSSFRGKENWSRGYLQILKKNKSEIFEFHSKSVYENLVYKMLAQVLDWGEFKLCKKLLKENSTELNFLQKRKLKLYLLLKKRPNEIKFLRFFLKNPYYGIKHLVKKILNK